MAGISRLLSRKLLPTPVVFLSNLGRFDRSSIATFDFQIPVRIQQNPTMEPTFGSKVKALVYPLLDSRGRGLCYFLLMLMVSKVRF